MVGNKGYLIDNLKQLLWKQRTSNENKEKEKKKMLQPSGKNLLSQKLYHEKKIKPKVGDIQMEDFFTTQVKENSLK